MDNHAKEGKAPANPPIAPMAPSRVVEFSPETPAEGVTIAPRTRHKSVGGQAPRPPRKSDDLDRESHSDDLPSLENELRLEDSGEGFQIAAPAGSAVSKPKYAPATTEDEAAVALSIVDAIKKTDFTNLTIKIIEGSIPQEFQRRRIIWIVLDFGKTIVSKSVVSVELQGLGNENHTFRGAVVAIPPNSGRKRGSSTLALQLQDKQPEHPQLSTTPRKSRGEFYVVAVRDNLVKLSETSMVDLTTSREKVRVDGLDDGDEENEEAYMGEDDEDEGGSSSSEADEDDSSPVKGKRSRPAPVSRSVSALHRAVLIQLADFPADFSGWRVVIMYGYCGSLSADTIIVPKIKPSGHIRFRLEGPHTSLEFMGYLTDTRPRTWCIHGRLLPEPDADGKSCYAVTGVGESPRRSNSFLRQGTKKSKTVVDEDENEDDQDLEIVVPASKVSSVPPTKAIHTVVFNSGSASKTVSAPPEQRMEPVDDTQVPNPLPRWFTSLIIHDPDQVRNLAQEEIKARASYELKQDIVIRTQAVEELKVKWNTHVEAEVRARIAKDNETWVNEYRAEQEKAITLSALAKGEAIIKDADTYAAAIREGAEIDANLIKGSALQKAADIKDDADKAATAFKARSYLEIENTKQEAKKEADSIKAKAAEEAAEFKRKEMADATAAAGKTREASEQRARGYEDKQMEIARQMARTERTRLIVEDPLTRKAVLTDPEIKRVVLNDDGIKAAIIGAYEQKLAAEKVRLLRCPVPSLPPPAYVAPSSPPRPEGIEDISFIRSVLNKIAGSGGQ
jgi:hypothetical protein